MIVETSIKAVLPDPDLSKKPPVTIDNSALKWSGVILSGAPLHLIVAVSCKSKGLSF